MTRDQIFLALGGYAFGFIVGNIMRAIGGKMGEVDRMQWWFSWMNRACYACSLLCLSCFIALVVQLFWSVSGWLS